jgi:hypothetical protein
MSTEAELRLKGRKTLAEVRKEIAGDPNPNPNLTQEIVESLDHPILALSKHFRAMKLKEEPIQSGGIAAAAEDIQSTFERVYFFDPYLENDKLSRHTLQVSAVKQISRKPLSLISLLFSAEKMCTVKLGLCLSRQRVLLTMDGLETVTVWR